MEQPQYLGRDVVDRPHGQLRTAVVLHRVRHLLLVLVRREVGREPLRSYTTDGTPMRCASLRVMAGEHETNARAALCLNVAREVQEGHLQLSEAPSGLRLFKQTLGTIEGRGA